MLYAFAIWTLLVWATRISNILSDTDASGVDRAVDLTLAVTFTVLGLAVLAAAVTGRHRARIVTAAAAVTVAVWAVRTPLALLDADHGAGFKVVHATLAVVSVALALVAASAARQSQPTSRGPRLRS